MHAHATKHARRRVAIDRPRAVERDDAEVAACLWRSSQDLLFFVATRSVPEHRFARWAAVRGLWLQEARSHARDMDKPVPFSMLGSKVDRLGRVSPFVLFDTGFTALSDPQRQRADIVAPPPMMGALETTKTKPGALARGKGLFRPQAAQKSYTLSS